MKHAMLFAGTAVLILSASIGCQSFPAAEMIASQIGIGQANQSTPFDSGPDNRALELPPKQGAEACIATAKELQAKGHVNEAILLYERARKLNPQQRAVSRDLALLYDQQGNDSRALSEYRIALTIAPRDPDLLNDFGYYFYRRHDWRQAEDCFRKAIAQAPEHERAWVNLGLALAEQERFAESFNAFAKILGPAAAHSNVGVILAAHHHEKEAAAAFRQALALQPTLRQPRAFLAHLENRTATSSAQIARIQP